MLHHTVKRSMEGLNQIVAQVLAQPPSEDHTSSAMAGPIVSCQLCISISVAVDCFQASAWHINATVEGLASAIVIIADQHTLHSVGIIAVSPCTSHRASLTYIFQ